MNCDFSISTPDPDPDRPGWTEFKCSRPECGRSVVTPFAADRIRGCVCKAMPSTATQCPRKQSLPCIHRGDELRREECPSCQGNVQVKVFACALLGECTIAKPLPGVQTCELCHLYNAPTALVLPSKAVVVPATS